MSEQPERATRRARSVTVAESAARVRADFSFALLDVVLIVCAYLVVLVLRFDGSVPPDWWLPFRRFVLVATGVHFLANWVSGLYGHIWRHAGIDEARRLLLAGGLAGGALALLYLPSDGLRSVPASVVLLGALLATVLIGGLRFQSRLFAFQRGARRVNPGQANVVVIGAGDAGAAIVREMQRNPHYGLRPVAILDDDAAKHGRRLGGVPILGGLERLPEAVDRFDADQALLAIPSADGELVRVTANAADAVGLTLKVLPSMAELLGGQVSVRDVRDLSIADLLGRQQVTTDLAAVRRLLHEQCVLITGAGGSIGSELARQAAVCAPRRLVLVDHDETHLHDAAAAIPEPCEQVLLDIRDRAALERLFTRVRPEIVFHAAAHKHVPILERHPCAAAETNVLGTANVVDAAATADVRHLVFISTDKAVRPSSVMGASKRIGELLVVGAAPPGSRWSAVRFGNVVGSRGSVIPTFMNQIARGGPVTVTDPRMTRFFMSIEEAVQLVLQAAALAEGGEVFMLEMGQPVRIVELAERMIRLSGRRVGTDVPVRITGIRPGEKLTEELHAPEELPQPTAHRSIVSLHPEGVGAARMRAGLEQLRVSIARGDEELVASALFALIGGGRAPEIDVVTIEDEPRRTSPR